MKRKKIFQIVWIILISMVAVSMVIMPIVGMFN